jgi:hypothetical protein
MAGLAARAKERQDALAADYYQQTLLRILPRDYKPMAMSLVESCANYKEHDLNPYEVLQALNKIRFPIDDHFRKLQMKTPTSGGLKVKIASVSSSKEVEEPSLVKGEDLKLVHCDSSSMIRDPHRDANNQEGSGAALASPPAPNGRSGKNRKTIKVVQNNETKPSRCRLCGKEDHASDQCPDFPEGKNAIAAYPCKKCHNNLYHFYKRCPLHDKEAKN